METDLDRNHLRTGGYVDGRKQAARESATVSTVEPVKLTWQEVQVILGAVASVASVHTMCKAQGQARIRIEFKPELEKLDALNSSFEKLQALAKAGGFAWCEASPKKLQG